MVTPNSSLYTQIYKVSDLADSYEVILFDIWGVLRDAYGFYPGVVEVVNKIIDAKKVLFVTNAPRLKTVVFKDLKQEGFNVIPEMIVTSGEIGRLMLAEPEFFLKVAEPVIYHLGRRDENSEILSGLNYYITSKLEEANTLVISVYRDEGEDLKEVLAIIEQASKFKLQALCFNPDTMLYSVGKSRYCAGYFALHYQELGGKVIYTGKPHQMIFDHCLNLFPNVPKNKFLMIGDTFATDIQGSVQAGIDSAIVLKGNMLQQLMRYGDTKPLDAVNLICHEQNYRPTHIVELKQ